MICFRALRVCRPLRRVPHSQHARNQFSSSLAVGAKKHEVVLDNQTLFLTREVAEALGWKPDQGPEGVQLTLHGWEPDFFTITPTGSDSEMLSKGTVESSQDENVKTVLAYLKDR
ncbi:hypothetical protein DFH06DRAFT_664741 [Mycena polygramma]|nr:hypothetical protein DFH06DRAFT_664741 [Mycena polygramma]